MPYKVLPILLRVIVPIIIFILVGSTTYGQRRMKKDTLDNLGYPYADFVNGGGFGEGVLLGGDYFYNPGDSRGENAALYTLKVGISDRSHIGLGSVSFDGLLDLDLFFVDYEFKLYQKRQFLFSGYLTGITNADFDAFFILPGIKFRIGRDNANVTLAYNPIIDVDNEDLVWWSPFFLNRNAGLQLHGYYHISQSKFSLFLNNSFVFEDVFDMWISSAGVNIDFGEIRVSPFIRNTYIDFFNTEWDTSLGFSFFTNL